MADHAPERGLAREAFVQRRREHAAAGQQILGIDVFAVRGDDIPAAVFLAVGSRLDPGVEPDVLLEIEAIGNEVQPPLGLGLRRKTLARLPGLVQFFGEPVLVDFNLGIEARAGIAVPVPGPADTAGRLKGADLQSQFPHSVQLVPASHARADYDRVERACTV